MNPLAPKPNRSSEPLPDCCRDDRHEVINGEELLREPIGWKEGLIGGALGYSLAGWISSGGSGTSLGTTAFQLADGLVRTPDGAWVAAGRVEKAREVGGDTFPGAPDLAVLIVAGADDPAETAARVADFLAHGTKQVWVISAPDRAMTVHAPGADPVPLAESETLDGGELLPGFSLPVTSLFPK